MPPDHRRQQQQRRAGAQEQQLPHRIRPDQELAHGVAEREHEDRQHHQPDAGKARGAVVIGGKILEEGHRCRSWKLVIARSSCDEAIQTVSAETVWIASLRSQ
jgi:hypothetical protein